MCRKKFLLVAGITIAFFFAGGVFACVPRASSPDESNGGINSDPISITGSSTLYWSSESDCASCHTFEVASMNDQSTLYYSHAALSNGECSSCHTDDSGKLAQAHENYSDSGATMPSKLKTTTVSDESCAVSGCHVIDELIDATSTFELLADANNTVVNPHSMLVDELHVGAKISCSTCHEMHTANGTGEDIVVAAAMAKCESCHHTDVFECNTCHPSE